MLHLKPYAWGRIASHESLQGLQMKGRFAGGEGEAVEVAASLDVDDDILPCPVKAVGDFIRLLD